LIFLGSNNLIFSNNQEYDSESPLPIRGDFYSPPSYKSHDLNSFREEEAIDV